MRLRTGNLTQGTKAASSAWSSRRSISRPMAKLDELERLAALHKEGAITEGEFEGAKKSLLAP